MLADRVLLLHLVQSRLPHGKRAANGNRVPDHVAGLGLDTDVGHHDESVGGAHGLDDLPADQHHDGAFDERMVACIGRGLLHERDAQGVHAVSDSAVDHGAGHRKVGDLHARLRVDLFSIVGHGEGFLLVWELD